MTELVVVILNYNSYVNTERLVKQLSESTVRYHIIIVDNCSTDNSFQQLYDFVAKFHLVDLIQAEDNAGYGSGNNLGIQYAVEKYGIRYACIVNPDVVFHSVIDFSVAIDLFRSDPRIGIVGGLQVDEHGAIDVKKSAWKLPTQTQVIVNHFVRFSSKRATYTDQQVKGTGMQVVDCVSGSFMIVDVLSFRQLNLFDEKMFMYNEENFIGLKLRENRKIEVVTASILYQHNHQQSTVRMRGLRNTLHASWEMYKSRRYLNNHYYLRCMVPLLWLAEMTNEIYYTLAYILHAAKDRSGTK